MRRRIAYLLPVAALAVLGLALAASGVSGSSGNGNGKGKGKHGRTVARALLKSADGATVANVRLIERRNGRVAVFVRARGVAPGFHGFHVHETGVCDGPGFTTAGGHYKAGDQAHGTHAGDMPPLFAMRNGRVRAAFVTDSFHIRDLVAGDGSAIMIHAGRDNLANIPTRYHSHTPDASSSTFGPDAETLETGDSGSRFACGVVRMRGR